MTIQEYHSHPALSFSQLSVLLQNAKKFKMIRDGELEIEGKALDIGSAFHCIVLEPEKFEKDFIVAPKFNKRTKAGKEEYEKFLSSCEGKIILQEDEMKMIEAMKEKLLSLKKFKSFLSAAEVEKSFFGEVNGVELRVRPDMLIKTKKGYIVVDLKTTSSEATVENFAKSSANFLYYMQEAVYREILEQNGINVVSFLFAYVSKLDYSGAIYCEHDYIAREEGESLFYKALQKYKYCKENDIWPEGKFNFEAGKFEEINTVSLPTYAFYRFL